MTIGSGANVPRADGPRLYRTASQHWCRDFGSDNDNRHVPSGQRRTVPIGDVDHKFNLFVG